MCHPDRQSDREPGLHCSTKILPNGSQTFEEQWQEEVIHGLALAQVRQQGRQPRFLDCQLNKEAGKIFGGAMQISPGPTSLPFVLLWS